VSSFLEGLKAGYRNRRNRKPLVPEDSPEGVHDSAVRRLVALAEVFELAGDYSAADVARSWSHRAADRYDPLGRQIAWAIGEGVFPDGCGSQ